MNRFLLLLALLLSAPALDACYSPPANAAVGEHVASDLLSGVPALNSAGDHVYAQLFANAADAGTVVTIVDGGGGTQLYTPLAGTGMTAGETDGSGCITASATTGKFTIADRCGKSEVLFRACPVDIVGVAGKTIRGSWHRTRSSVTTQLGPIGRKIENGPKADAGNVAAAYRGPMGCVETIQVVATSDTYEFRFLSDAVGDTVTVRGASLTAIKLLN